MRDSTILFSAGIILGSVATLLAAFGVLH